MSNVWLGMFYTDVAFWSMPSLVVGDLPTPDTLGFVFKKVLPN